MVKILISYDMQQGKEQECQEYLVNKIAPALSRMGFQFSDIWYTIWGESPEILGGGELESLDKARSIFQSNAWDQLAEGMESITDNFKVKIVQPREE
jgi:hypothetical protein